MKLTLKLKFRKGYIAHPYWPEREQVINIEKESGTRRAKSEANRAKALSDHLRKIGLDNEAYVALVARADRQFYTAEDVERTTFGEIAVGDHDPDEIVVPPHQLYGCFAQACENARASVRITSRDNLRSVVTVTQPVYTGKTTADGTWSRFAVVTAGTGAKLSNQRALRTNQYIGPFTGTIAIEFDDHIVSPDKMTDFVAFAGHDVGVGASRKMGWGRFELTS